MATVLQIQTPTLTFHALADGPEDGELVLCLHGFPDVAHSWDALLPKLAAAGYRAIAPWMRGYHPTPPAADGDYTMRRLGQDAIDLVEALGRSKAVLVGYDWGATAVYMAVAQRPDLFDRVVISAIPHARALNAKPWYGLKAWHFLYFQLPWAAWSVHRNDFALVEKLVRQWSPNWDFPPDELDPVKEALSHPESLDAALAYYWALKRVWSQRKLLSRRTEARALLFAGTSDLIPPSVFHDSAQYFSGGCEVVEFEGPGHFLHREVPDRYGDKVIEWLAASAER
jgi:pimeloyl-ACP methyl ester carboxylesterase